MADVNYQRYTLSGENLILHQIRCYCRDNNINNIKQFINDNNAPLSLRKYAWKNPIKEYEPNNTLDKNNEYFHITRKRQMGGYPKDNNNVIYYIIIISILLYLYYSIL